MTLIANILNKNVSAKKLSRKKSLSEQIFKQAGIFNKILTFFSLSFWRGRGEASYFNFFIINSEAISAA